MKHKVLAEGTQTKNWPESGFTLIELLVAISIMLVITGSLVLGIADQRAVRSLVLAKNETIANIRKIQSEMLSSRNISGLNSTKFYIINFTAGTGTYTIDALDSAYGYHTEVDKITMPGQSTITDIKIGSANVGNSVPCVQIIYSAPFGKMYTRGGSSCTASVKDILIDPVQLSLLGQQEAKIFITNSPEYINIDPVSGQVNLRVYTTLPDGGEHE